MVKELANRKNNASGDIVEAGQNYRKNYVLNNVIPEKNARKHNTRTCHIHDLEFYDITYNCIGVSVSDLIGNKHRNFNNMISTLHRAIVEVTNNQSGGIGFINFDSDIAPYIANESDGEIIDCFRNFFMNLNMNTRKGCEKPYVTFNFGLETSENGRRASRLMLEAYEKGDERGNPFIFPNLVFKLKASINVENSSPNHDLYLKALNVTSKRMVPTYFNCDSSSNRNYLANKIGIMGCRTRVASNVNGLDGSFNRGNVACVTLNLVQLAYQADHDIDKFFELLQENMDDAKKLLLHRFYLLCKKGVFDDVYKKGYYLGAEKEDAYAMLKNGTLSIGFIGLWDAVSVLINEGIDSIDIMRKNFQLAYSIIQRMRDYTDQATKTESLNFSLLASAAEGVTGNFAQYDSMHLGREFDVCKKGFYTNSFHVPVDLSVNYKDKIDMEGRFHHLCNGGSITYIELNEMPGINIEAVKEIVEYAYENDCNYIGINFPMDNCKTCGFIGKISDKCPCCKSVDIRRLRRVSGYLSEEKSFTSGKHKELKQRKSHLYFNEWGDNRDD